MNRWEIGQWAFLLASEGFLALLILGAMGQILAAVHTLGARIDGRVDELLAETRARTIAETRELVRKEQERDGAL